MNSATKDTLRSSFARIASRKVDVAAMFYARLFEIAPSVRPLFKADLTDQQQKLMVALIYVVQTVDTPQKLIGTLSILGKRHLKYGVKPEHYDVVGEALLWTFEQILGEEYTPAVRDAWTDAYALVANTMRAAAASVQLSMLESPQITAA